MKQNQIQISQFDPNELKMFTSNLSKLLSKCDDIKYVQKIHSYINSDDIFIQNLLIKSYGEFADIQSSINIFNDIANSDKDTVTLKYVDRV